VLKVGKLIYVIFDIFTLESISTKYLKPFGEGKDYAGGILSAKALSIVG